MKAWMVYVEIPGPYVTEVEWIIEWAPTRGKAKQKSPWWPEGVDWDWTAIKARRVPALDGKDENTTTAADLIRAGLPLTCWQCGWLLTQDDLDAGKVVVRGMYVAYCAECAGRKGLVGERGQPAMVGRRGA